jgi:GNAT superfamily N-acetyltransferase
MEHFDLAGLQGRVLTVEEELSVRVSLFVTGEGLGGVAGTISADHLFGGGRWWLSRCLVRSTEHRGKGLGGFLVQRLLATLQPRPDFKRLEVVPGGYGSDTDRLGACYARCGFRLEEDGLYAWVPPDAAPSV